MIEALPPVPDLSRVLRECPYVPKQVNPKMQNIDPSLVFLSLLQNIKQDSLLFRVCVLHEHPFSCEFGVPFLLDDPVLNHLHRGGPSDLPNHLPGRKAPASYFE